MVVLCCSPIRWFTCGYWTSGSLVTLEGELHGGPILRVLFIRVYEADPVPVIRNHSSVLLPHSSITPMVTADLAANCDTSFHIVDCPLPESVSFKYLAIPEYSTTGQGHISPHAWEDSPQGKLMHA